MTSSKELKTAEKEMRKADKQFAAAEKAYEKGNVKAGEKHENRANALAASAQEHASHAQQVGILATGVTAPHSVHGGHHGAFSNAGAWNGGFMNVAPTTAYKGTPVGNYNPTHAYAQDHPYHHSNFSHNGTPLGQYNVGSTYAQDHPYSNSTARAATTAGLTTAAVPLATTAVPLTSGLGSTTPVGTGLASGLGGLGQHHGSYSNGLWNGGFMNTSPSTQYQGHPIGNYDPFHSYAAGHPYHHSNYQHNGQPLGQYQAGTTYPSGHPYHGIGSGVTSGLGGGLTSGLASGLGAGTGLGVSPFGQHHNSGGFYNVAPTTLYQGQAIGRYNPATAYAKDHPYHHSNFQHNGQPLGAYQAGTTYPQGHPYHGFGSTGSGLTSVLGSGLGSSVSPFGAHHNTGGFYNVAPTTVYQGQPIGNFNPSTAYAQGHPYHHSNFQYNGQPLGAYQAGTSYPQGHPYHGFGSTGSGLGSVLTSGLGSGLGSGLTSASPFGAHHNTGGFYNVAPTTQYKGQPIGNFNPSTAYAQDHPYHHSNFQYNGQPLGAYQSGTSYPQGHPYHGFGSTGSGLSSVSPFGAHHNTGGFYNVAPTTQYQGQAIGSYNPLTSYAQGHPYHHSNFQHNGQPLGAYQAGTAYPQGHPYHGFGTGSSLGSGLSSGLSGLSLGGASPFGQHHGTGGFYNVSPTTLYQNQPIGNYNPLTSYAAGHPYHHSNFQYQGQPLQAYQAGTVYPQGHPYHGFGDLSRGTTTTSTPVVTGHTYVPYTSPFGQNHGTWVGDKWVGGLFNVAPSTIYNGHAVGNYDPSFNYPQDHPYHHSHHTHNGSPFQPFAAGTSYPQGHPFYGRGLSTTTGALSSGLTSALGSGVGSGLTTGTGLSSGLGSGTGISGGLGSALGRHHGSYTNGKWQGGFMDVDPIVAYNGQPIGNFDPTHDYAPDHPYHHSKFQHNGQPLGRFQRGTQYPQGHPYYGIL